jgi:pimeloyl-ACP methyl ester carboxylesterase
VTRVVVQARPARRTLVACAWLTVLLAGAPVGALADTVTIRTDDGAALVATLHVPSAHPAPGVVFVHMQGRSRRDWEGVATRLSASGFTTLTVDLRGHGDSPGAPAGPATVADVRAAVRYLLGRRDIVNGTIGIAGASMGANAALVAAAAEPVVRSLALLSPGMDILGVRIEPALRDYTLRPILLLASREDYYAVRSCGIIAGEGGGIREFQVIEGTAHGTVMLSRNPDTVETLLDWFRRTLL